MVAGRSRSDTASCGRRLGPTVADRERRVHLSPRGSFGAGLLRHALAHYTALRHLKASSLRVP